MIIPLSVGNKIRINDFLSNLTDLQYKRSDARFERGYFRVRGDIVDIFPSHYENKAWRLSLFGDEIEEISEVDAITGNVTKGVNKITIFPNSYYITPREALLQAIELVKKSCMNAWIITTRKTRLLKQSASSNALILISK